MSDNRKENTDDEKCMSKFYDDMEREKEDRFGKINDRDYGFPDIKRNVW